MIEKGIESDTPRTDAMLRQTIGSDFRADRQRMPWAYREMSYHAERLERELDAAKRNTECQPRMSCWDDDGVIQQAKTDGTRAQRAKMLQEAIEAAANSKIYENPGFGYMARVMLANSIIQVARAVMEDGE